MDDRMKEILAPILDKVAQWQDVVEPWHPAVEEFLDDLKSAHLAIVETFSASYLDSVNAELSPEYRAAYDAILASKHESDA